MTKVAKVVVVVMVLVLTIETEARWRLINFGHRRHGRAKHLAR